MCVFAPYKTPSGGARQLLPLECHLDYPINQLKLLLFFAVPQLKRPPQWIPTFTAMAHTANDKANGRRPTTVDTALYT